MTDPDLTTEAMLRSEVETLRSEVLGLRAESAALREELAHVLADWNALREAIGSPTNGGAIGWAKQLRAEHEAAVELRKAIAMLEHNQ